MLNIKNKVDSKDIFLIIVIVVLVIVNLILALKTFMPNNNDEFFKVKVYEAKNNKTTTITVPQTEEEVIKKLSTLGERDRMEYYCGNYFKHIQKGEYEEAYSLLYEEFKQKYFPTVEEYIEYINKTYPVTWALEYDDITRQGYIYVLNLYILDLMGNKENKKSQRIVIQENNYNDYVISFQVI